MSKELIKINTNEEGVKVVSARELHQGLGVGKVFGAWIKNRIDKYCFVENEDYTVIWSDSKTGNVVEFVGSPQYMASKGYESDYVITIDMAKELAMVENNEKGVDYIRNLIKDVEDGENCE